MTTHPSPPTFNLVLIILLMSFCILITLHTLSLLFFLVTLFRTYPVFSPCVLSLPPSFLSLSYAYHHQFSKYPLFLSLSTHPFTIPFLCTYNTHIKLNITTLKTLFDFRIGVSVVSAIVYKCLLHAKMACISPVQHEQVQGTSCATRQRQRVEMLRFPRSIGTLFTS